MSTLTYAFPFWYLRLRIPSARVSLPHTYLFFTCPATGLHFSQNTFLSPLSITRLFYSLTAFWLFKIHHLLSFFSLKPRFLFHRFPVEVLFLGLHTCSLTACATYGYLHNHYAVFLPYLSFSQCPTPALWSVFCTSLDTSLCLHLFLIRLVPLWRVSERFSCLASAVLWFAASLRLLLCELRDLNS